MAAPGRSLDLGRRKSDNLCDPHDLAAASDIDSDSVLRESARNLQVRTVLAGGLACPRCPSPLPTLSCYHTWTGETTKEAFPPPSQ